MLTVSYSVVGSPSCFLFLFSVLLSLFFLVPLWSQVSNDRTQMFLEASAGREEVGSWKTEYEYICLRW